MAKNPGVFNMLAELSAEQLIVQVLASDFLSCCGCAEPLSVWAAHLQPASTCLVCQLTQYFDEEG